MPPKVVAGLFKKEFATGDNRGTGLGVRLSSIITSSRQIRAQLPSCALFCKAGGGYCRLKATQQQDEARGISAGFTEFEFGLKGEVVRRDSRDYISENKDDDLFVNVSVSGRRQDRHSTQIVRTTSATLSEGLEDRTSSAEADDGQGTLHDPLPSEQAQTMPADLTVVICDDSGMFQQDESVESPTCLFDARSAESTMHSQKIDGRG